MRASKTPQKQKSTQNNDNLQEMKAQRIKIASLCLKNSFEGMIKRIQCQVIGRFIAQSSKYTQKVNKIKFIVHFANGLLKRKKQTVLDKLKRVRQQTLMNNKAVINLCLLCRRMTKDNQKHFMQRLRQIKNESKVVFRRSTIKKQYGQLMNPRLSEESGKSSILSMSEDSIADSRVQILVDEKQYGNQEVQVVKRQIHDIKRLELDRDTREKLMKMLKFDRNIFSPQNLRALNISLKEELKRFQKYRNQHPQIKSKYHDNELTITNIINQIQLISQINQEYSQNQRNIISQTQKSNSSQGQVQSSNFTQQQTTTLSMLNAALKSRQFSDIKREIDYFMKRSKKAELVQVFRQVERCLQFSEVAEQSEKRKQKQKIQILNTIGLADKHLRTQKIDELQKLKNKTKNVSYLKQTCMLIETIITVFNELKKYKKKESMSAQKIMRTPEKSRIVQSETDVIKRQLKNLQNKYDQLQRQHDKLKEGMKKNVERVHPSMLPKKTSAEKDPHTNDNKYEETIKKYKQIETDLQNKLDSMSKDTKMQLQKAKLNQQSLEQKMKKLENELQNSRIGDSASKLKLKQTEDFVKLFTNVKKKLTEKQSYVREVNQFKRIYGQGILLEIIERITTEQANKNILCNQIKNIINLLNDGSWKRKQAATTLKNEGQLYSLINQIIQKSISLLKEKQQNAMNLKGSQNMKKREESLIGENMSLKDQMIKLKEDLRKLKEELNKQKSQSKQQNMQINAKTRSPERLQRTSIDRQVSQLRAQNRKLQDELALVNTSKTNENDYSNQINQLKNNLKTWEIGLKTYEIIKGKRLKGQPYIRDQNQFKRMYPQNIFVQIFESISREEALNIFVLNKIKGIITFFGDASARKKQCTLLVKEQGQLNSNINKLIELMMNLSKDYDELLISSDEITPLKKRQTELNEQNLQLKNMILPLNQEIKTLKQQTIKLRAQIKTKNDQMSPVSVKQRSPAKSVTQKQIQNLKIQNQQLKSSLQQLEATQQSQTSQLKLRIRQFDEVMKYYELINNKKNQEQNYSRELNQFKRKNPQSIFALMFEKYFTGESKTTTLVNQIKIVRESINDGTWKRKQNIFTIKQQTEPNVSINQLIQTLLALLKQKQDLLKQNAQLPSLSNSLASSNSEIASLKQQIKKLKLELSTLKKQNQSQTLRQNLQNAESKILLLQSKISQRKQQIVSAQELKDLIKLYHTIKSKKMMGQSPIKQVNQYKKKYASCSSLDVADYLFSSIIEEYNKNSKDIQPRKNTQLTAIEPPTKEKLGSPREELQLQKLREENTRLKSEVKNRPESPEIKQKLNIQKQKTIIQSKQISQLKLQVERLKSINQQNEASIQQLTKKCSLLNTQLEQLQQQNEKNNKIQTGNAKTNLSRVNESLEAKNLELNALKKNWQVKQRQYETELHSKNQQINELSTFIKELEQETFENKQTLNNYHLLIQKMKDERDNICSKFQQKAEEFVLIKQNEASSLNQKRERQLKIQDLKHRYEQTQRQIKRIEKQVQILLQQKQQIVLQNQNRENNLKLEIAERQNQLKQLKVVVQQGQRSVSSIQAKLNFVELTLKNELASKQHDRDIMNKQLQIQNNQIILLKDIINNENNQLRARYQKIQRSLEDERRIQEEHRNGFKDQGQSSEPIRIPLTMTFSQDYEKSELRKQLQLVNQELGAHVRNSENQKRQMRLHVQKLNNDIQMQTALFNEEKRILRQDIERVRNEEYEISHQKMKRLREDIQDLRSENERLTAIIDNNEEGFNELINEHRDLTLKVQQLMEINHSFAEENQLLVKGIHDASQQKLELILKLEPLEKQLQELENQIGVAMQQKQQTEQQIFRNSQVKQLSLQATINQLTQQKRMLEIQNTEQSRSIMEMHQNIIRAQSELKNIRMQQKEKQISEPEEQPGKYSQYLQQKLNQQTMQIKRYMENQNNLIGKIQHLMRNIGNLEKEMIQLRSQRRDKQFLLATPKSNTQKDTLGIQQKLIKLETTLSQKQRQIIFYKGQQNQISKSNTTLFQYQHKIGLLDQQNRKLAAESYRLKTLLEEANKELQALRIKAQQNIKLNAQNRLINAKYHNLQSDHRVLQMKVQNLEAQLEEMRISQENLLQNQKDQSKLDIFKDRTIILQRQQEIVWFKNQLSGRQMEIQKLRGIQIQLSNQLKRQQERFIMVDQMQQNYQRQLNSRSIINNQIQNIEEFYQSQIQILKTREENLIQQNNQYNDHLHVLQQENRQLIQQNKQLEYLSSNRAFTTQILREIVFQLDERFVLEGSNQELELRILQKISYQITGIIQSNKTLKSKCLNLQNSIQLREPRSSQKETVYLLHQMTQNLLSYLQNEQKINPQELNFTLKQMLLDSHSSIEMYITNLTNFFKNIVSVINRDALQLSLQYSSRIDQIKYSVQQFLANNTKETLKHLKDTINFKINS